MEEPLIIKSLQDKRAEIHGRITAYEAQIEQAKHDLAHVNATLRLFTDVEKQRARYVVSHGFFRKGEIADLCVLQLQDTCPASSPHPYPLPLVPKARLRHDGEGDSQAA